MKKSLYTIATLCIGVIIGMTSTTFAAPAKELVQASFAKIKFVVNGEEKPLDADPLVYQGTTYLPVRTVLNALGYDAGYKADTKTVTADKATLSDADSIPQKEGEQTDMSVGNPQNNEKQIESLNKSINDEKETIETIKQLIQDAQERTDASDELKKQKVEDYNKRIQFSEKMIKIYEDKITELQK